MIVVDTNVLAARAIEHEKNAIAGQVEAVDPVWIVPTLWRYEFQNVLAKEIRARRTTVQTATNAWLDQKATVTQNEHDPSAQRVLELVERHQITAYDANFIALAMEIGTVCVTEDRELREKFPAIALSMADFIKQRGGWTMREARETYRVAAGKRKKGG